MIFDIDNPPPRPTRVFVDGIEQHQVIYVDTDKGIVRCHRMPKDGLDIHGVRAFEFDVITVTGLVHLEPAAYTTKEQME